MNPRRARNEPRGRLHPPGSSKRLIPPRVLAGLANLELIARTAVEGTLIGLHRSPRFGFSQEFAEYRAYAQGDDPRFIDWNVFARTDRTYVKRFFGDTNTRLMVLVDASASMGIDPAPEAVAKLDYARYLAAALTYLAARQHDAVGLLVFDERVREYRAPSARQVRLKGLYHVLDTIAAAGATDWQAALGHIDAQLDKRSLVVLISDFYCEPDHLARLLRGLAARGHDLVLAHLLDPAERRVELRSGTTLRDAETDAVMEVTPEELSRDYPVRLEAHLEALRQVTLAAGGHYLAIDTDQPLDAVLAGYLRFRARHP